MITDIKIKLPVKSRNSIPELDGIRAISILLVVFYHIFWVLGDYMTITNLDRILLSPGMPVLLNLNGLIDMFFIISAFLSSGKLVQLYETGKFNYNNYIYERFIRIFPVLTLAISLYIFAGLDNAENCWNNLFYINIFQDYQNQCMIWSWYLSVQELYLLFIGPAVVFLLFKFPRMSWWIIGISGLYVVYLFRIQTIQQYHLTMPVPFHPLYDKDVFIRFYTHLYSMPQTRMLPLLFGSIIGWAYKRTNFISFIGNIRKIWMIPALIMSAILILPGFILISPHHGSWDLSAGQMNLALTRHGSTIMFSLFLILLLSNNVIIRPLGRILSARFWYPFSFLSLQIYLFHLTIIYLLYNLVKPQNPVWSELWLYYFIVVGISILLAIAANALVDRCSYLIYKFFKN